jgi:hypothetical protein
VQVVTNRGRRGLPGLKPATLKNVIGAADTYYDDAGNAITTS